MSHSIKSQRRLRKKYRHLNKKAYLFQKIYGPKTIKNNFIVDPWTFAISGYFTRHGQRSLSEKVINRALYNLYWSLQSQRQNYWLIELGEQHLKPAFIYANLRQRFPSFSPIWKKIKVENERKKMKNFSSPKRLKKSLIKQHKFSKNEISGTIKVYPPQQPVQTRNIHHKQLVLRWYLPASILVSPEYTRQFFNRLNKYQTTAKKKYYTWKTPYFISSKKKNIKTKNRVNSPAKSWVQDKNLVLNQFKNRVIGQLQRKFPSFFNFGLKKNSKKYFSKKRQKRSQKSRKHWHNPKKNEVQEKPVTFRISKDIWITTQPKKKTSVGFYYNHFFFSSGSWRQQNRNRYVYHLRKNIYEPVRYRPWRQLAGKKNWYYRRVGRLKTQEVKIKRKLQPFYKMRKRLFQKTRCLLRRIKTEAKVSYRIVELNILDLEEVDETEIHGPGQRYLLIQRKFGQVGYQTLIKDAFSIITPTLKLFTQRVGHKSSRRTEYYARTGTSFEERCKTIFTWLKEFSNKNPIYNFLRRNPKKVKSKKTYVVPRRSNRLIKSFTPRLSAEFSKTINADEQLIEKLEEYHNRSLKRIIAHRHYRW